MSTVLTWLGTYWIHSTILLAIAWALDHALRDRPDWREPIWRAALLGGLVTATLQVAAPIRPWGGTWFAGAAAEAPLADEARTAAARAPSIAEPQVIAVQVAPVGLRRGEAPAVAIHVARVEAGVAPAAFAPPARFGLREAALSGWGIGAALLLFGLWRSWRALERRLAGRRGLDGTPIQDLLWSLTARAPRAPEPRLTASARVDVPMALGILRPEICLPERALVELAPEAQEAMLAHELGHVARRDPLWRLIAEVTARTLFFQPLNWLAARRLSACAELLADDWAARRTAEPLSLAECLTTVAQWATGQRRGALASSMAGGGSELGQRVDRLVRGEGLAQSGRQPRWSGPAVGAALIALALLAPSGCAAKEASARPATPEARHGKAGKARAEAEEARREVEEAQREVEEAKREVEEAQREVEEARREVEQEAREEAREARREAKREVREAMREARRAMREQAGRGAHPHARGPHAGPDAEDEDDDEDNDEDEDDDARPGPRRGRFQVMVPPPRVRVPPPRVDVPRIEIDIDALEKEVEKDMERAREEMRAELQKARAQIDKALKDLEKEREKALKDAAKVREKALKEAAKARKKALKEAGRKGGADPDDE